MNVEAKKDVRQPGTGITGGFEVSCGCLRSNPGHPEEQPVIFRADPPVVLFLFLRLASKPQGSAYHWLTSRWLAQMCSTMRGQLLKLRGPLWWRRKAVGESLVEIPNLRQGEETISRAQVDG